MLSNVKVYWDLRVSNWSLEMKLYKSFFIVWLSETCKTANRRERSHNRQTTGLVCFVKIELYSCERQMKEVRREVWSNLILIELDHLHFVGIWVHFSVFEYLDELKARSTKADHSDGANLDVVEVAVGVYRRLSQKFVDLIFRVPVASSHQQLTQILFV